MLTASQVEAFVTDGFVKVAQAFPREVADAGRGACQRCWRSVSHRGRPMPHQ